MPKSSMALAAVASCIGCVVTTYEGPGEPAAVASGPPPVSTAPPAPETGAPPAPVSPPPQPGKLASDAGAAEPVQASHILIQYRGSMRARPAIIRTKEEARA